jgi:hypothetical protein
VHLARANDQELLLLPGKPDRPVWGSGPFGFPVPKSCCPAGGRHVRNVRVLRSSLCSQNLQQVLTIPSGRASAAEPMVRTTLSKVDKAGTSSTEVPTA